MKKFNSVKEQESFDFGVEYAQGYIAFCMKNYVQNLLKNPCPGACKFQSELCYFIIGKSQYIPNKFNVTFEDFCENYEKYRLKF